ncbi:DUF4974 domain-containing protein [Puteibacter caeruleilacunae]|nr:DUF4974 domain-containing protein [Puteibacter caeruleilacunae]
MSENNIKYLIELVFKNKALTRQEMHDLDLLLTEDGNKKEVDAYMQKTWEDASSVDTDMSVDSIWERINQIKQKRNRLTRIVTFAQKYAAILLIPLTLYAIWLNYQNYTGSKQLYTINTAKAEQTTITLPDGTTAWLNVGTTISYNANYNKNNRRIKVNGEAYFDVFKNPKLPFIVNLGDINVKALGTEFNVNAYSGDDIQETTLYEGSVEITSEKHAISKVSEILKPGETIRYSPKKGIFKTSKANIAAVGAWRKKQLSFEDAKIEEVVAKAERWYNVKIKYNPKEFKNETLTVRLKANESLDRFLEIIEQILNIETKKESEKVIILKKKPM